MLSIREFHSVGKQKRRRFGRQYLEFRFCDLIFREVAGQHLIQILQRIHHLDSDKTADQLPKEQLPGLFESCHVLPPFSRENVRGERRLEDNSSEQMTMGMYLLDVVQTRLFKESVNELYQTSMDVGEDLELESPHEPLLLNSVVDFLENFGEYMPVFAGFSNDSIQHVLQTFVGLDDCASPVFVMGDPPPQLAVAVIVKFRIEAEGSEKFTPQPGSGVIVMYRIAMADGNKKLHMYMHIRIHWHNENTVRQKLIQKKRNFRSEKTL